MQDIHNHHFEAEEIQFQNHSEFTDWKVNEERARDLRDQAFSFLFSPNLFLFICHLLISCKLRKKEGEGLGTRLIEYSMSLTE